MRSGKMIRSTSNAYFCTSFFANVLATFFLDADGGVCLLCFATFGATFFVPPDDPLVGRARSDVFLCGWDAFFFATFFTIFFVLLLTRPDVFRFGWIFFF